MTSQRPAAFALLFLTALLAFGSSDVAFCGGETEAVHAHVEAGVVEETPPEVGTAEEPEDEEYGSDGVLLNRPEDHRPRTTKRLYTTIRSVRGSAKSRGLLSGKRKFIVLGIIFTFIVIYLVMIGRSFVSDEDGDEDDEKRGSEAKRDS